MDCRTARGERVTLGREPARGGEGAIREVTGRADWVAKLYAKLPSPERAAKLAAMARSKAV